MTINTLTTAAVAPWLNHLRFGCAVAAAHNPPNRPDGSSAGAGKPTPPAPST
eukprot:CAMPEP_0170173712 /NCGR_PEP_ID=MMETSP0040_2-20121228/6984_1 /TAXON_ID=641309 /ORGANISM="Lotharella oceanica, Strain CCMP622" /LENGTH=51 /DNA_ID=CAMNT_0010415023 /DNA_START=442 /DNA_END=595 /DNA_ORIENTATION=+